MENVILFGGIFLIVAFIWIMGRREEKEAKLFKQLTEEERRAAIAKRSDSSMGFVWLFLACTLIVFAIMWVRARGY